MHENKLRERLHAEMDDVEMPPQPGIGPVLTGGRRRRQARHATYAVGGLVAVVATTLAIGPLAPSGSERPDESGPIATGPTQTEKSGGDINESARFDAVTRRHLRDVPLMGAFELDEDEYIRPPNWSSSDAISLADRVLRVVDFPGVQTIDIGMKYSWGPNDPTFPRLADDLAYCEDRAPLRCDVEGTSQRWTVTEERVREAKGERDYWLEVRQWRDGGQFGTVAQIGVYADSLAEARDLWAVDTATLRAIATDPELEMNPPNG